MTFSIVKRMLGMLVVLGGHLPNIGVVLLVNSMLLPNCGGYAAKINYFSEAMRRQKGHQFFLPHAPC